MSDDTAQQDAVRSPESTNHDEAEAQHIESQADKEKRFRMLRRSIAAFKPASTPGQGVVGNRRGAAKKQAVRGFGGGALPPAAGGKDLLAADMGSSFRSLPVDAEESDNEVEVAEESPVGHPRIRASSDGEGCSHDSDGSVTERQANTEADGSATSLDAQQEASASNEDAGLSRNRLQKRISLGSAILSAAAHATLKSREDELERRELILAAREIEFQALEARQKAVLKLRDSFLEREQAVILREQDVARRIEALEATIKASVEVERGRLSELIAQAEQVVQSLTVELGAKEAELRAEQDARAAELRLAQDELDERAAYVEARESELRLEEARVSSVVDAAMGAWEAQRRDREAELLAREAASAEELARRAAEVEADCASRLSRAASEEARVSTVIAGREGSWRRDYERQMAVLEAKESSLVQQMIDLATARQGGPIVLPQGAQLAQRQTAPPAPAPATPQRSLAFPLAAVDALPPSFGAQASLSAPSGSGAAPALSQPPVSPSFETDPHASMMAALQASREVRGGTSALSPAAASPSAALGIASLLHLPTSPPRFDTHQQHNQQPQRTPGLGLTARSSGASMFSTSGPLATAGMGSPSHGSASFALRSASAHASEPPLAQTRPPTIAPTATTSVASSSPAAAQIMSVDEWADHFAAKFGLGKGASSPARAPSAALSPLRASGGLFGSSLRSPLGGGLSSATLGTTAHSYLSGSGALASSDSFGSRYAASSSWAGADGGGSVGTSPERLPAVPMPSAAQVLARHPSFSLSFGLASGAAARTPASDASSPGMTSTASVLGFPA